MKLNLSCAAIAIFLAYVIVFPAEANFYFFDPNPSLCDLIVLLTIGPVIAVILGLGRKTI